MARRQRRDQPYTKKMANLWKKSGKTLSTIRITYGSGRLIPTSQNKNTMKKIIATMALAILAFAPAAMAEEVAYVAGMTGVV